MFVLEGSFAWPIWTRRFADYLRQLRGNYSGSMGHGTNRGSKAKLILPRAATEDALLLPGPPGSLSV